MVMLAAVAVLWLIPPERVLEMTRAKSRDLTATTFRHSIAYRRMPIAIFLSWVRVTRPSAHRTIQLTSRAILKRAGVAHSSTFTSGTFQGTRDQYATIDENLHVTEKEMFNQKREKASRMGDLCLSLTSH
jgi:hypothetical protein